MAERNSTTKNPIAKAETILRRILPAEVVTTHDAEIVDPKEAMVAARQEIEAVQTVTGYMARAMVLATIPHSRPPDDMIVYSRQNGDYTLALRADPQYGLPYGTIPRMLMSWITMEAVRTQSPTILLGDTLSEFMQKLGYTPRWGEKGTVRQIKEQAKRLFGTGISCTYYNPKRGRSIHQSYIASDYSEWWLPYDPNQRTLWESNVVLSHEFFQEIINRPVPISLEALANLRKSPMALDVYFWLTHRNFGHSSIGRIGIDSLQHQFGTGYPLTDQGRRNFKKKLLQALKKISETYTEAGKLCFDEDVLIVPPGRPDITHNPAHKGVRVSVVTPHQPRSVAAIAATVVTAVQNPQTATALMSKTTAAEEALMCWERQESVRTHNANPNTNFKIPETIKCPNLGDRTASPLCEVCPHNPNYICQQTKLPPAKAGGLNSD
jgi:hypothetical protein